MSYKALADAVEMMNDGVDALSKRMDAMKKTDASMTAAQIRAQEDKKKTAAAINKHAQPMGKTKPKQPEDYSYAEREQMRRQQENDE
jgi:hypothetical protein